VKTRVTVLVAVMSACLLLPGTLTLAAPVVKVEAQRLERLNPDNDIVRVYLTVTCVPGWSLDVLRGIAYRLRQGSLESHGSVYTGVVCDGTPHAFSFKISTFPDQMWELDRAYLTLKAHMVDDATQSVIRSDSFKRWMTIFPCVIGSDDCPGGA
jgi:hypothetical protein